MSQAIRVAISEHRQQLAALRAMSRPPIEAITNHLEAIARLQSKS